MSATALPPPIESALSNGLRVVVVPQQHLQGATLSLFVKVGPRYERREVNGVSHFLEHMLFRGTAKFENAYQLSLASERLGGTIEAATYADFTHYQLSVPGELAEEGLELLAELFRAPRFLELALEKQIVREEILADLDASGREVDPENLSRMLVYGEHPLGFKITGDADNVDRLTLDDLRAHLRDHYGASNTVLVVTGNVDAGRMEAAAARALSSLPVGKVTLIDAPPPARHDQRVRFVKNDSSQTELRACLRSFANDDPDFMALKLLMRVLDDGMSTRLHRRMTDESGLAYEAFAALDSYEETGLIELGASVEHDKAAEALRAMLELLSELRDGEIRQDELDKARTRYLWNLRRIIDSAEEMAMYAGTQAVFGRNPSLAIPLQDCEAVTLADLRRAARRVIRAENLYVVFVGKVKKVIAKRAERVLVSWR